MSGLVEIHAPGELAGLKSGDLKPVATESLLLEAPDSHWVLLDAHDILVARCSLWWKDAPPHSAQRLGVIGHYAAADAPSANCLLKHGCAQLSVQGCTLAVGPMDGNTWRRYRFITERGTELPFFLETDNPDDWPQHFVAAGFSSLATYTSALNSDLARSDMRTASDTDRIADAGISLRHADAGQMEKELRRVYRMSLASFQQNFLYTPLDETEFLAQYRKVLPYVRPELVLLAERDEQPVGFLFALPDILKVKRQEPNDTIIIKTIAVLPEFSGVGLGTLLVARAQENARELGFKRAIHALMHESNRSRNISHHTAVTMRRYTLFSRLLSS
jgi:GNAT superfamily N-acetyltransferase